MRNSWLKLRRRFLRYAVNELLKDQIQVNREDALAQWWEWNHEHLARLPTGELAQLTWNAAWNCAYWQGIEDEKNYPDFDAEGAK